MTDIPISDGGWFICFECGIHRRMPVGEPAVCEINGAGSVMEEISDAMADELTRRNQYALKDLNVYLVCPAPPQSLKAAVIRAHTREEALEAARAQPGLESSDYMVDWLNTHGDVGIVASVLNERWNG